MTAGVYQLNESWTYDVADINSDGRPDLFLAGHDRGGAVMLNNPVTVAKISTITAEAVADADGNGYHNLLDRFSC